MFPEHYLWASGSSVKAAIVLRSLAFGAAARLWSQPRGMVKFSMSGFANLTEAQIIVAGAAAVIVVLVALISILALRGAGRSARELDGRLRQLAESQAATQALTAETLRSQERALSQAMEQRLSELSQRIGNRLSDTAQQQHTTLTSLHKRLEVIDRAQQNITQLSSQVVGLQDILANKQARGAFGEIQLKDLVEAILPPSAFAFQVSLGETRRVDCLLKLPNPPGPIAIDAKFPLESYQMLRDAENDAQRLQAARRFTQDVRKHIQDIAAKYIVPGETAESALMFLPSEAVYAELHANFTGLVEESFRARVWIVSPTTLMATLNTVRAILKDVRMREQADVIQAEMRKLLDDVRRLDERVVKLQQHFGQASEDIRKIRISTEKVTRGAERIEGLQLEDPVAEAQRLTEGDTRPKLTTIS